MTSRFASMLSTWLSAKATLLVALYLCVPSNVSAQTTFVWNGSRDNWASGFAWAPTGTPGAGDIASFERSIKDEILWDNNTGSRQIFRVSVTEGDYSFLNTVDTTQHELTINSSGNNALAVLGDLRALTIQGLHFNVANGGGLLAEGATINLNGNHPLGTRLSISKSFFGDGDLNISNGAVVNVGQTMLVGHAESGSLLVESGGNLTSRSGTLGNLEGTSGIATVTGEGSTWDLGGTDLTVGNLGSGVVSIEDGARVSSDRGLIGLEAGGTGTVTVKGAGSKWTDEETTVGNRGNGTLNILDGGEVSSGISLIGRAAGVGNVNVSGLGSKWNLTSFLDVGQFSTGNLTVEDGGTVLADGRITIGGQGSQGTATVTGTGSELKTSQELFIGTNFRGDGTLNIQAGAHVASKLGNIGSAFNQDPANLGKGIATITGVGSQWVIAESLTVGPFGQGTVNIQAGGALEVGTESILGQFATGDGAVTVTGRNSKWSSAGIVRVGAGGKGKLDILAGGEASNGDGVIGDINTGTGNVTVSGQRSQWTNSGDLFIANEGTGTLTVAETGLVTSKNGFLGNQANSTGEVTVSGQETRWTNSEQLFVGNSGKGSLKVSAGGRVSNTRGNIGHGIGSTGQATVSGPGSKWISSEQLTVGAEGSATLLVEEGGEVNSVLGVVGETIGSVGTATVTGQGSQWKDSENMSIGVAGKGTLDIAAGGTVENRGGIIGSITGGTGNVNVAGDLSSWKNSAFLTVGSSGNGTLLVEAGGAVSSREGTIGLDKNGIGAANIKGAGSNWVNRDFLIVGFSGSGALNAAAGGVVSNKNGFVGLESGSLGTVAVSGQGSQWRNSENLSVGVFGQATLTIDNQGLVAVARDTSINSASTVNLNGGRFEFGTMNQSSAKRINAQSGSLAGTLNVSGAHLASSFTALTNSEVDSSGVNLVNAGVLSGSALLGASLTNQASGEVELLAGERMRFGSSTASTNAGEINNFGGRIAFQGAVANDASGLIAGRGVFAANEGWTNNGAMAFSGGFADVQGDVANGASGRIVVTGGSTTTFLDDVFMSAGNLNVNVSQNSNVVFLGSYNGGSTGPGTVHALGDLRPGNSPAAVRFGGDLMMGANTVTQIELGGANAGLFDELLVAGNLFLSGKLDVQLIDGFQLSPSQVFDVGVTDGLMLGQFSNLNDGDLVGNFGGIDLFIQYRAGLPSGNGFSLVTAVPEPSSAILFAIGVLVLGLRCRRQGV